MSRLTDFFHAAEFIRRHPGHDPAALPLQQGRFPGVPLREVILQLQARQKARTKLPGWTARENTICYPSMVSLEQCSSEITARFKASLVGGGILLDLTGGMGVDAAAFAARFKQVILVEQNAELAAITDHNLRQLGVANVRVVPADATAWLPAYTGPADWVYLDPARRDDAGGKVVRLQDCEPPVLALRDELLRKTGNVLLKASPMLDIDLAVRQLQTVAAVYVVAIDNEVKELLFHLTPDAGTTPEIRAVNVRKTAGPPSEMLRHIEKFHFHRKQEAEAPVAFGPPEQYLYEPNAALLKAGAFRSLASAFGLQKLHPNSHLYTSAKLSKDFPGRAFRIKAVSRLDKNELHRLVPSRQANVAVRNFPLSVADVRRKAALRDGGNTYLFATTDPDERKLVLVCEKA